MIFLETPSSVFGDALKKQVEDRLKFYESGEAPRKNIDVMKEAIQVCLTDTIECSKSNEFSNFQVNNETTQSAKKKKKKKRKTGDLDDTNGNGAADESVLDVSNGEPKKKKKKGKQNGDANESSQDNETTLDASQLDASTNGESKKKKKKKKQQEADEQGVAGDRATLFRTNSGHFHKKFQFT